MPPRSLTCSRCGTPAEGAREQGGEQQVPKCSTRQLHAESRPFAIGEIGHDIDCKDARFGRSETAGVASVICGIVSAHHDDVTRLDRGGAVLDDL